MAPGGQLGGHEQVQKQEVPGRLEWTARSLRWPELMDPPVESCLQTQPGPSRESLGAHRTPVALVRQGRPIAGFLAPE